jgi:hypothetical protein
MAPRGDVTKLPKWAQQYIETLERDRDHYRGELDEIGRGEKLSVASLRNFLGDAPIPLAADDIRFKLTDNEYKDIFDVTPYYQRYLRMAEGPAQDDFPNGITVSCINGRLDVEPRASNSIIVRNVY